MYNSILTNINSIKINNNLNLCSKNLSNSLERISSGFKINQAKDDAAGCVLSSRLENKISGLDVAMNNTSHADNLLNIADNVLENMIEQATKIRGLCLKALNSTNSQEELQALQEQINELSNELERQRQTTKYNGAKIFETQELKEVVTQKPYEKRVAYIESTGTQYIDTGYVPNENTEIIANIAFNEQSTALQQYGCITNENGQYSRWHFGAYLGNLTAFKTIHGSSGDVIMQYDNDFHEYYLSNSTAGIDGKLNSPSITQNSDVSFALFARNGYITNNDTANIGYYTKSKLQDLKIYEDSTLIHSYIPVVDYDGKCALYDEVTKEMLYNQGSGEFIAGEEVEDKIETHLAMVDKEPTVLQIGNNDGIDNTLEVSLGFDFGDLNFDISSSFKANFAIKKANQLIDALSTKRANVGATASQINSLKQLQANNKENLISTKSNIMDTDIAQSASEMAQLQIMQQVSTSLFTQAHNICGNLALRLLNI